MVHPIEGHVSHLKQLGSKFTAANVYGLQYTQDIQFETIEDLASAYIKLMKKTVPAGSKSFTMVAYSLGATISFEICLQLQRAGLDYTLVMLDGSHSYVKMFTRRYTETQELTEAVRETEGLCSFMERNLFVTDLVQAKSLLLEAPSMDARLEIMAESVSTLYPSTSAHEIKMAGLAHYKKLSAADIYSPTDKLINQVLLVKAEASKELNLPHDYGLGEVCTGKVEVETVPGNHYNFVIGENAQNVADIVQKWIKL